MGIDGEKTLYGQGKRGLSFEIDPTSDQDCSTRST